MNVPDEDSIFVIDSLLAYNSHPCCKHIPIFHTFTKSTNPSLSLLFRNVLYDSGSFWKGLLTFHSFIHYLFGSTKLVLVIMSIIFRDPFFDNFDDILVSTFPKQHDLDSWFNDGIRRDVITPFSGFGRMDMKENEKEYEMSVDLPGMDKSEIKMHVENNGLVIEGERKSEEGERKSEKKEEKDKCHFCERHFGSFHREVSLPKNANVDGINAMYENGVLKVVIPKKEESAQKKQICVN